MEGDSSRGVAFKRSKVVGKCGRKPWLATAAVPRKVYASFKVKEGATIKCNKCGPVKQEIVIYRGLTL